MSRRKLGAAALLAAFYALLVIAAAGTAYDAKTLPERAAAQLELMGE